MAVKRLLCVVTFLLFHTILAAENNAATSGTKNDVEFINNEHKLKNYLFKKDKNGIETYEKSLRPIKSHNDSVEVQIGISMLNMIELNEKEQKLVINGYLKLAWTDLRFSWKPEDFGGLTEIHLESSKIWKPDIMVYNNAELRTPPDDDRVLAIAYSHGYVLWIPPKRFETKCRIDFHHFPYDYQRCSLLLGSWTFSSKQMFLSLFDNQAKLETTYFEESDEWDLMTNNGSKIDRMYACCPDTSYEHIQYDLTFRRKSSYYTHVYISPAAALSVLIPFIFLMPPETGDKTILAVGLILAYVLMIAMLENFFPSAMSNTPLLGMYYAANLVLSAMALLFTHLFTLVWRGRWKSAPPKLMSCIIVGGVGKLVCVKHHGYAEVEEPTGIEDDTELSNPQDSNDRSTIYSSQASNATRRAMMDWKLIVMVMDRVFFLIFLVVVIFLAITLLAYGGSVPLFIDGKEKF